MKKISFIPALALTILVVSATAPIAFAQGNTTSYRENLDARRAKVQQNVQERQENRQEKKAEITQNVQERQENRQQRRDDIAQRHAERLGNRFGLYSQRLTTLIGKIDTKLTEMANNDKDTTLAQAKVEEARTSLSKATTLGNQAIAAFEAIEPAEYDAQREQALAARDLAQQAREQYKTTASLLREAVQLAKNAN